MIQNASEFLQIMQPPIPQIYKLGIVAELFEDGSPKILFDGESTASEKKYPYLASYSPVAGDRILITSVSGSYVVLGKIVF